MKLCINVYNLNDFFLLVTAFYQGELSHNGNFYGQIFANRNLVNILREHLVVINLIAADGTYQTVPNNAQVKIKQLFSVHVIYNDMVILI